MYDSYTAKSSFTVDMLKWQFVEKQGELRQAEREEETRGRHQSANPPVR